MTLLKPKGDWHLITDQLKQRWPELTDADLEYTEGAEEALFAHIQTRTSADRHDIEDVIATASSATTFTNPLEPAHE